MLIGAVAELAGVTTQTIRFYERRGLIQPARRTGNGYRDYSGDTVDRLGFIQSAQACGLTLDEIGSVLRMRDDAQSPCAHVTRLLGDKLLEIQERQRRLARLELELQRLLRVGAQMDPSVCGDDDICRIIERVPTSGRIAPVVR